MNLKVKKINKYGDITNTEVRVMKIDNNYYYINEKDVYNKIFSGEYITAQEYPVSKFGKILYPSTCCD